MASNSSSGEAVPEKIPTADATKAIGAAEQAKFKEACDKYVSNGLTSNRTIQYLINQLDKLGCTPPAGFVRCTDCGPIAALGAFHLLETAKVDASEIEASTSDTTTDNTSRTKKLGAMCSNYLTDTIQKISRTAKDDKAAQDALMEHLNSSSADGSKNNGDSTKTPEIFLCQQHLSSEGQAHRVILHELIHAVDTCRTKMDPQRNCIHLACTEIRAENLSSECNFVNELMRIGPHSLRKHGQDCVKRRAMLSVKSHPRCRERAEEYVDAAMGRCYKDIFPFERHPNEQ